MFVTAGKIRLLFVRGGFVEYAVENGLGAAVCMNVPLGKHKLHYLNLEEVEPIEQVTTLVYRSDKALNEAMRYFIQLLTEQKEDLK